MRDGGETVTERIEAGRRRSMAAASTADIAG
jgi:hypothetical protein